MKQICGLLIVVSFLFNVASALVAQTVSISPASVESPAVGDQFTVSLKITGGANVAGYQATVTFDTAALRYVESANGDYLPAGAFFVTPNVTGNQVPLSAVALAGESNGAGTLATVTFEGIAVKTSTLTLSDVVLSDSAGVGSQPQVENGQITRPSVVVNKPDLVVQSPRVSKSTLSPGESFTLSATVRNSGSGGAAATTLRYYRSTNTTISTRDTQVGTDPVSSLSANRNSAESITLNAPSTPGTYYYGACVDALANESNSNNNCSTAVTVTVVAPTVNKPDLVVQSPRVSKGTLSPGESFTLSATVRNSGSGGAAATTLRYYRSTNTTISRRDTQVGTDPVSSLSANRNSPESITLNAPTTPGTYYYGACVDTVANEADTNNNCSTAVTVTVGPTVPPTGAYVYWTDQGTDKIQRANLDGSQIQDIVTGLVVPPGIALDVAGGKMYWTRWSPGKIQRANLNGTHIEDLVTGLSGPRGIALDVAGGKMYWTDAFTPKIRRANLDGSQIQDIVTLVRPARDIALDVAGGKMYWTTGGKIQRSNLDGTQIQDIVTGLSGPRGIALDIAGGKMYWTRWNPGKIQRSNLDGTQIEDLVAGLDAIPGDMALDVAGGKMYWVHQNAGKIRRANLNGTQIEDLVTGLDSPLSIALMLPPSTTTARKPDLVVQSPRVSKSTLSPGESFTLSATVRNSGSGGASATTLRYYRSTNSTISRRDTQVGTDAVSSLNTNSGSFEGITLNAPTNPGTYYYGACVDAVANESNTNNNCSTAVTVTVGPTVPPTGAYMYWTDWGTGKIQRANLNGTQIQDIVTGLSGPRGIALDIAGGKMYWADEGTDKIQRANLNGTQIQDIVTGLSGPDGIALDIAGGKMYWTDFWGGKIQRANLNGTQIQDIVTGLSGPDGIALDIAGGKMYWTDFWGGKIQRANLNGTQIQDIVTGLSVPRGIALDIAGGKMYWGDEGTDKIQRANLNGTQIQDIVTGLGGPIGMALDIAGGKMYWTDFGTGKIQRANLNGTQIQDIFTGLSDPYGIALMISPSSSTTQQPDLVVQLLRLSKSTFSPGESFTLAAIVRNSGSGGASATTLRYYRSTNTTISRRDTQVGTDAVGSLNANSGGFESIILNAPTTPGTYYYGACVDAVSNETDTTNNCSTAVTVTVSNSADVNRDGVVDLQDIAGIIDNWEQRGQNNADVNGDGIVNVEDIVLVLAAIETAAAAPAFHAQGLNLFTAEQVQQWFIEAKALANKSPTHQRGILRLEQLLMILTPKETALLPNYPNPFNPETWIPYHLANASDVRISIYDARGTVVRRLALGHQQPGYYTHRSRAAYWNGKNKVGEPVASGVYFYTLTAGDFSANRKMLIRK